MAYLIHLKKNAKLQKIFLISSKKSMLSPTPTPTLLMFYDMLWTENFDQLLSLKNKADVSLGMKDMKQLSRERKLCGYCVSAVPDIDLNPFHLLHLLS